MERLGRLREDHFRLGEVVIPNIYSETNEMGTQIMEPMLSLIDSNEKMTERNSSVASPKFRKTEAISRPTDDLIDD